MRSTQLRAFDAVAREGSFTAAAERLGLTQPAVTVQVRRLEDEYGVSLLHRAGRGVALTGSGRELFKMTREMFSVEERIGDFLMASEGLQRGHLRLSADGPHWAMELIAAFRRQHPGIRMAVALGNRQTTLHDLIEHRADVAVLCDPPNDDRIHTVPLVRSELVAIVPTDHPWSKRRRMPVTALEGATVVLREPTSNTRQNVEYNLRKQGVRIDAALELGSREAIVEAVAAGLGIGFMFARETGPDPRYKTIVLEDAVHDNLDMVACFKSQMDRVVIKAFLEVAESHRLMTD